MVLLVQTIIGGLTAGSVYAIVALGVVMIYKVSKVLNLAQGEFCMLGALFMVTLWGTWGIAFYTAILLAIGITVVLGLCMERFLIRPLRRAPISTLLVITVGFSIAIRGASMVLWGKDPLSLPSLTRASVLRLNQVSLLPEALLLWAVVGGLSLLLWVFFERTNLGKAIRACAENPDAASLTGINVLAMHRLSYALSAGVGALGGILFAPITFVTYDGGIMIGLKGFAAAMMGGVSQIFTGILTGFGLGVAESLSATYVSSQFKDATAFLLLVFILILRSRRAEG